MSLTHVQPKTALFIGLYTLSLRGNPRVKRSPLINDAGIGCACPSPAVSAAHACGIVCQGQQLLGQLPAVHQQKHRRLCCRLHLQHKTQITLHISRKTNSQDTGATMRVQGAVSQGQQVQGQQLQRQLLLLHQRIMGASAAGCICNTRRYSSLHISRKTPSQNAGATKMSCVCKAMSARGDSSCGSCRDLPARMCVPSLQAEPARPHRNSRPAVTSWFRVI